MSNAPSPELPALDSLLTPEGADAALAALYGGAALPARGVVHVASAWDGPGGRRTIRITESSPKSAWDFFALELTRARADAIVLTGAILREEPALRYELSPALAAHRRRLGKRAPPELWVLTRGSGLDLEHPALHGAARPVLFTPEGARAVLPAGLERRALPEGGLRALLENERRQSPERLVAIEAGPSTSRALYDAPPLVDELLLTLFEGPLPPELEGGALPDPAALEAVFGPPRTERVAREAAGTFRFLRYRRDPAA